MKFMFNGDTLNALITASRTRCTMKKENGRKRYFILFLLQDLKTLAALR